MEEQENRPHFLRVLIAESDRVVARDLERILRENGFTVCGLPDHVDEFVAMIEAEKPELVLMSVSFGGGEEGINLAGRLRERWGTPVIFITGHDEETVFHRARLARPVGYVRKPFCDAEIVACVEAAAQRLHPDKVLEERLSAIRSVAEPLEDAVIVAGIDGRIVLMNPSAETLTGWSEEEANGRPYSDIVASTRSSGKNGHQHGSHCDFTDKKGVRHTVEAVTSPVRDDGTEVLGTITILKDAPAEPGREKDEVPRQRAEVLRHFSTLAESPAYREVIGRHTAAETGGRKEPHPLIDQLGDPLVVIDRDGRIVQANTEAAAAFAGGGQLIGQGFWDFFTEEEYRRFEPEMTKPLVDGKRHRFEFQDAERAVWYDVCLYRSHEGILALFQDNTETRMSKADELRQHRLEGLGLLARGFVHDFSNHLTTVTGNLGLARQKATGNPEVLERLDEAEAATYRAAGLVQQLMTFASGGRPIREPVKIPDLLRQVLSDHRTVHPRIRYQFQSSETDLKANVDRGQVKRVVENLINNAEDAMPEGGVLILRCGRVEAERAEEMRPDLMIVDEEHLLIEVVDHGSGIPSHVLTRVFDPYFSTREENNASGIGLTVCESIARAHDGFVSLESAEGKGTTARFCVPMGFQARQAEWSAATFAGTAPKTSADDLDDIPERQICPEEYRLLILEDDEPIRRLMGMTLRRAGYHVVETGEGRETIGAFVSAMKEQTPFDLVISDLTIQNGMGGVEAIRRLREIDPKLIAIVSSGYSDDLAMANPEAFGFRAMLQKPYSPFQLEKAVEKVLATYHPRAQKPR